MAARASTAMLCIVVAACAGTHPQRRVGAAGVTLALPPSWHSTRPDQGNVTNPLTRIVVSSAQIGPDLTSSCQGLPSTYTFPNTAVAIVVVEWTKPLGGMVIGSGPRRPKHFTPKSLPVRPPPAIECWPGEGGGAEFAEHGRSFAAFVLLGRRAPPRLASQARAVLDTLRVASR